MKTSVWKCENSNRWTLVLDFCLFNFRDGVQLLWFSILPQPFSIKCSSYLPIPFCHHTKKHRAIYPFIGLEFNFAFGNFEKCPHSSVTICSMFVVESQDVPWILEIGRRWIFIVMVVCVGSESARVFFFFVRLFSNFFFFFFVLLVVCAAYEWGESASIITFAYRSLHTLY